MECLIGIQPCPFIPVLSVAVSLLQWLNAGDVMDLMATWLKIVTAQPFLEKICWCLSWEMLVTGGYMREEWGSSVCWALAWAGHHLEGFAFMFYISFLAGFPLLSPCAPCPLSPFLLLPAWGGGRKGREMEVGWEGGIHPLVSGVKAFRQSLGHSSRWWPSSLEGS